MPIYVGFFVLDMSKVIMYDFFYGLLKPQYGYNYRLLYTDADSLIFNMEIPYLYNDMKRNMQYFGTSNDITDNVNGIVPSQSVVGKMKDEYAGTVPNCFITATKFSFAEIGGEATKKAKGSHYESIPAGEADHITCRMYVFRSHLYDMFTEKIYAWNSLAWGHKKIGE